MKNPCAIVTRIQPKDVAWVSSKSIARWLKQRASTDAKIDPYREAMAALKELINRQGKRLTKRRKHILAEAIVELKKEFRKANS